MKETYLEFVERNQKELTSEQAQKHAIMQNKVKLQGFASDSADQNYIKNNFKVGDVIMYPHWSKDLMKPQIITNWEKHPMFFMPCGIIFGALSLYLLVDTIIQQYKQSK